MNEKCCGLEETFDFFFLIYLRLMLSTGVRKPKLTRLSLGAPWLLGSPFGIVCTAITNRQNKTAKRYFLYSIFSTQFLHFQQ